MNRNPWKRPLPELPQVASTMVMPGFRTPRIFTSSIKEPPALPQSIRNRLVKLFF